MRLPLHLIFFRFSSFNCCLSVVLQVDKEDYPENLHVVLFPNKWRYFESFMCLDLVLERYSHSSFRLSRNVGFRLGLL